LRFKGGLSQEDVQLPNSPDTPESLQGWWAMGGVVEEQIAASEALGLIRVAWRLLVCPFVFVCG
jgi:hypothetical protein